MPQEREKKVIKTRMIESKSYSLAREGNPMASAYESLKESGSLRDCTQSGRKKLNSLFL